jgi:RsiW-degrading membrane proteinase PrsW (M82 family)
MKPLTVKNISRVFYLLMWACWVPVFVLYLVVFAFWLRDRHPDPFRILRTPEEGWGG